MTAMLHPDELLERDPQQWSPSERALVDAHLAQCSACRLLTQARVDFASERLNFERQEPLVPETSLDPARVEELRALPRRPRPRIAWLLVAMGLLSGAATAAGGGWSALVGSVAGALSASGSGPSSAGSLDRGRHVPSQRVHPTDDAAASAPLSEQAEAPGVEAAAGIVTDRASSRDIRAPSVGVPRSAPLAPARRTGRPGTAPDFSPSGEQIAAALFERATAARTRGDYDQALADYRELERRYPSSPEAQASRVAVARLLLDTGRTAAALDDYDSYLAGTETVLTEEALLGRALANERLGHVSAEKHAWQSLLRTYPGSVHALRARSRLAAIEQFEQE